MRRIGLVLLLLLGCDDDAKTATKDGGPPAQQPNMQQPDSGARDGGTIIPGQPGMPARAKVRVTPNVIAGSRVLDAPAGQPLRIGSASATDLKSLKYYITSIVLCEELDIMGSGFSGSRGCVSIYQNMPAGAPDYDTYLVEQAQADSSDDHFIDLMSSAGQAKLRQPVTVELPISETANSDADAGSDDDAGTPEVAGGLRYGLINFYRPIKVTAEFPLLGSEGYVRTRAVTKINTDTNGGPGGKSQRVEIADSLSGPTEETTYMLNNGGAFFVFQKPFVITRADAAAGAEIKVDLVFNPDSFGQAHDQANCRNETFAAICDPTNDLVIDMPYVRMSPVPRKAGEKTRKETYLMSYETGSKLRIELYYNDADPEAGIQGVDTAIVYDASATLSVNNVVAANFVSQSGSVRTGNAAVTLRDYEHTPNLEGLRRRHDGTATIHCLFTGSLCPTLGGTVTRAYTYQGESIVSSD